ncbi:MAG: hypothetical protein IPN15_14695 [Saprospiraceae bacterium]|nr:hypothetical protein [Candidatus Vicinibacter affinis]
MGCYSSAGLSSGDKMFFHENELERIFVYEHNLNTTIPIKNALKNFQSESLKFHLFPNPTEDILYLKAPLHAKILHEHIEIIALDGKSYLVSMAALQSNKLIKIEIGFLTQASIS